MSPVSNRARTMSFVSFTALLALSGCQSAPETADVRDEGSFATIVASAPISHGQDLHEPAPTFRPVRSSAFRAPRSGADEPRLASASDRVASLPEASVPVSRVVRSDSPAVTALALPASPAVVTDVLPGSPAVLALATVAESHASVFVIECASDADCMVDACDATSCVPEAAALARDSICLADPAFDPEENSGCLCQAGRCGFATSDTQAARQGI